MAIAHFRKAKAALAVTWLHGPLALSVTPLFFGGFFYLFDPCSVVSHQCQHCQKKSLCLFLLPIPVVPHKILSHALVMGLD